jgi:AGZA family xanthine/uracil permease-like MFS transporter
MNRLDSYFGITARGSTLRTELLAGLATFLTMAYIIVVNPAILADTGMDFGAVFVATILAAALSTALMGLWANWPVALGAVFLSGLLALALSLTGLREWIINSIPRSLKLGIGAGIGLFLALIGLRNAGVVVDHPATLVGLGDLSSPAVALAALGFIIMIVFDRLGVPGAVVIGILAVSIIGWFSGIAPFQGVIGSVPSMAPTFLKLDVGGVVSAGLIAVVFAFLFVDFFDTAGTLTSVANLAGKVDAEGRVEGIGRAVISDSAATVLGALFGTSNTTSYIESGAGIKEGGRTGLTAVVVAALFVLCLGFAPLAKSIPSFATAAALTFVATFFVRNIADIDWDDATEYGPAILGAILMPLTYSIANGIAIAFIAYAVAKLAIGQTEKANAGVLLVTALSIAHYALG